MNLIEDIRTLNSLYWDDSWSGDISYFTNIPIFDNHYNIMFNTLLEYLQYFFEGNKYTIFERNNHWFKKPFILKDPNIMVSFIIALYDGDDLNDIGVKDVVRWFKKNIHTDFGDSKLTICNEISDLITLERYFQIIIWCNGVYSNWSTNVLTISDPNILHEFIYNRKNIDLGYEISWIYTLGICSHFIDFNIKDLVSVKEHDELYFWIHWLDMNTISQLPISIVIDYFHVKPLPLHKIRPYLKESHDWTNDLYDTVVDAITDEQLRRCIYLFLWIFDDILPLEVIRWVIFPYLPSNQTNIIRKYIHSEQLLKRCSRECKYHL